MTLKTSPQFELKQPLLMLGIKTKEKDWLVATE